ncbi:asparagine synthase (glutamine-hydrolyzing) [Aureivirga sp. CE67]|uniref:asparagine synthase (glutamine-hydrolyzing) n=1 Tax=Aureivirga sp. CE67 TaxID=1788983 RepID=UPI0018CAC7B9|nr:asparagine synthase (glutamine-hydrolyzing) [Aureivirga sp. CE67]
MCGITGFWKSKVFEGNERNTIQKMTETLHHRGPDGNGFFVDDQSKIAMGHARLSIIDLHSGEQPIYSNDKNLILTVNGEFYDYKRIRVNLKLEGFDFTTKSDSEIALPLYRKNGLDFLKDLRGEFAFALFDKKEEKLILVRDRFGVKPLFYHINEKGIYWASEMKTLFENPDISAEFDDEAVLHQLMQTMVPGTTPYKNIQALEPGHMLIIQKKNDSFEIKNKKYWDLDFPREKDRDLSKSEQYHIKRVQEELVEAVSLRLEADVPVGCYLSGGIDSCAMLGLSSYIQQSPIKAFTISFDNQNYDETKIADEMSKSVNADQEHIILKAEDLYEDNYIKTLWYSERTFYNTLGVAKWHMSKRVKECGYRAVITGEGSDELFGGYAQFKRDMFLHSNDAHKKEFMQKMDSSNKIFKGAILSDEDVHHPYMDSVLGFTPSWIQPWVQTLHLVEPLLSQDYLYRIKDYDPIIGITDKIDTSETKGRHVLDIAQYTWSKTMLECQILNWGGDRVDMANSMESRPAFLDHHLAEMAKEIPPEMRIKGNIEKWVLREAVKNVIPEVLYKREKFAFMAPPAHTDLKKKAELFQLINEFLDEKTIKEVGVFDVKKLQNFILQYKNDHDPVSLVRKDALINHILGLHILYRMFVKKEVLF